MPKLHELLAAEKTPAAAWAKIVDKTIDKFKKPDTYFRGSSLTLKMFDASDAAAAMEAAARVEKPVTTDVYATLTYALNLFANNEQLQAQKNATNRVAGADIVLADGSILATNLPVDELLGLEARLKRIKDIFEALPTLDSSKHWVADQQMPGRWVTQYPEVRTKTEKRPFAFVKAEATDKHPAQVDVMSRDEPVGKIESTLRSGEVTAVQKSEAVMRIDALMVAVKKARMRANETEVVATSGAVAKAIVDHILHPLVPGVHGLQE